VFLYSFILLLLRFSISLHSLGKNYKMCKSWSFWCPNWH